MELKCQILALETFRKNVDGARGQEQERRNGEGVEGWGRVEGEGVVGERSKDDV